MLTTVERTKALELAAVSINRDKLSKIAIRVGEKQMTLTYDEAALLHEHLELVLTPGGFSSSSNGVSVGRVV